MVRVSSHIIIVVTAILLLSCKYPYEAELKSVDDSRLVVDGYIDVGQDAVTQITISRTTPVNEETYFLPEQGAQVSIEDEESNSFFLSEVSPGIYQSDSLNLPQTKSYRLKILLGNERVYVSEYNEPLITPEIDSVSWEELEDGVQIYVSTHDPENKTKYYQWNYEEVWERTVPFVSYYRYENSTLILRPPSEVQDMQLCWKYITGADVNVKSSAKYPEDIIPLNKIKLIPRFDERVYIRYSITVRQHALSETAYTFYEILNKNGSLGTFSDPMPSELPGNLYRLDAPEPVVGYIGAYTTQTKRLEILSSQIKPGWIIPPACYIVDTVRLAKIPLISQNFIPYQLWWGSNFTLLGADMVPIFCADCRVEGGTNIRPSFWSE